MTSPAPEIVADPPARPLPTLQIGRDPLPAACAHCGSALLNRVPPLGPDALGLLSCVACGRSLAWLRPAPRRTPPARTEPPRTSAEPRRLVGPIPAARFQRQDGCAVTCGVLTGHDPAVHEAYGRAQALTELVRPAAQPCGVVRTGLLTVDLDLRRILVGDWEPPLTPIEAAIVFCLARQPGRLWSTFEVVVWIWDRDTAHAWGVWHDRRRTKAFHPLRVHLTRLRAKLGPAGRLIETVPGRGLRLREESPEEATSCA